MRFDEVSDRSQLRHCHSEILGLEIAPRRFQNLCRRCGHGSKADFNRQTEVEMRSRLNEYQYVGFSPTTYIWAEQLTMFIPEQNGGLDYSYSYKRV